tara:strand:+ start:537 stop:806 length:270 start_codon:yes stop_codon:yes gene_type:complete
VSGHTPGPWTIQGAFIGTDDVHIAQVKGEGRGVNSQRAEANSMLMAAAPDLLDALKMALEAPDDDRSWEDYAIAAIKKADPLWEDNHAN